MLKAFSVGSKLFHSFKLGKSRQHLSCAQTAKLLPEASIENFACDMAVPGWMRYRFTSEIPIWQGFQVLCYTLWDQETL
jgi:hypothetical protein